jgi:hypothetical protein
MNSATALLIIIGSATFGLQALGAAICGGDDFDDGVKNTNLWGADVITAGGLLETNGRLEIRGTASSGRSYIRSYRSCNRNWEVRTDVSVGNVPLNQPSSGVQVFLVVANRDDTNLRYGGIPGDNFSIALDLWRSVATERSFEAYFRTDWTEFLPRAKVLTTSQQAAIRITFDATTKTLTAWYDEDGSAGGYTWTALRSEQVTSTGSNWEMTSNSSFAVFIGAGVNGDAVNVTSADLVYADNFSVCEDFASPRLFLRTAGDVPLITIQGPVGTQAELQCAAVLSTNSPWLTFTNLALTNSIQTVSDSSAAGATNRYYRARLVIPQP